MPASLRSDRDRHGVGTSDRDQIGITAHLHRNQHLLRRAKRISSSALIAQRLKRLPSIALKLRQNQNMKLSQMQDIGGCRAIMRNLRDAKRLMKVYKTSSSKNPRHGRPVQYEVYDYIAAPKPD